MQTCLNRREFLASTAALLASGCSTATQADHTGPAKPTKPTIIDTHTHFYDPSRPQGVPWPPAGDKVLYRTVLPKDYLKLDQPQKVAGTVVVEASPWIEDNQWILDLAEREPFIVGFVGNLPVGTPEFTRQLKRFAANKFFRGIRIRDRKLDGALEDAAFVSDLKLLASLDLSLDLVGGMEILPFAYKLSKTIPELRIVIDHLAGLRIDGKAPPSDWMNHIRSLSKCGQVNLKVSGLVEGTGQRQGKAPREGAHYRPVLDAIWNIFGPSRLIYGSNWPVCEHYAPLATVQSLVLEYFSERGVEAIESVFLSNAKRVYRWIKR